MKKNSGVTSSSDDDIPGDEKYIIPNPPVAGSNPAENTTTPAEKRQSGRTCPPQSRALPERVGLFSYYHPLRFPDLGYGPHPSSGRRQKNQTIESLLD
jgi:hypothetical protein